MPPSRLSLTAHMRWCWDRFSHEFTVCWMKSALDLRLRVVLIDRRPQYGRVRFQGTREEFPSRSLASFSGGGVVDTCCCSLRLQGVGSSPQEKGEASCRQRFGSFPTVAGAATQVLHSPDT